MAIDSTVANHLERIKSQTVERFSIEKIPEWICKNTFIEGERYSFKDHEYQERILRDTSQEVITRKCSQVGMTETSIRLALALCGVTPYYTCIYTLPTASFASNVMSTRVDPIITASAYLSEMVSKQTNNSEIKQLGDSFLYMKGSASGNAPISIPADHLIHDEIDFSDLEIIEQYQSRLTHSIYKRKHKLSTPTHPGYGIDEEFSNSRRHYNMVKCEHCNEVFIPSYYDHVKIPGFDGDLREITKRTLATIRWKEAEVFCPRCGRVPSLQAEHRLWVCENSEENFVAAGYQVSPFDAPNIISAAYLVEASTKYERRAQFVNFNLGLPMQDSETTLTAADLDNAIVQQGEVSGVSFVMGLDMGLLCHCVIAAVMPDGRLVIAHAEQIPLGQVMDRRKALASQYWPRMTVVDAYPYTETVMRMQQEDSNLFAAVYAEWRSIELHRVVDKEEQKDKGALELRQVNINRNKALDALMMDIRIQNVVKMRDESDALWKEQLQDMTRTQKFTASHELEYVWSKSKKGNDHFHHATLYASTAAKMLGVSHSRIVLPAFVSRFKMKKR